MKVTLGVQLTAVDEVAFVMLKEPDAVEPSWFASPANVADALVVPTLVLFAYVTATDSFRPPTPVTVAVQASIAAPVNVTLAVQLTAVVEVAFVMLNEPDAVLPSWFASPAKVALAAAVPTVVLFA